MAFGFPPKQTVEYGLSETTPISFIAIATEAVKQIGWNLGDIHENSLTAYTGISMSSYGERILIIIDNGIAHIESSCTSSQILDWGKNKRNINRLFSTMDEIKVLPTAGELTSKSDAFATMLFEKQSENEAMPLKISSTKMEGFISVFKPVSGYFITPVIMLINILLFIIMVIMGGNIFLPENEVLLKWGANFRPATLDGEWWRLITNCFLHIGIIHLLLNMYALVYIGLLLEPIIGKQRFITAYLLTGVAASMTSLYWHDNIISAGASGAIFGMYGVFLAPLTTKLIDKATRKALLTSIGIFVGYNLLNGLKGGIDNAAHLGGSVTGLIVGYAFVPGFKNPGYKNFTRLPMAGITAIVLLAGFILFQNLSNDIVQYQTKMKSFVAMESMALEVLKMPDNTPKEKIMEELKEKGIYYWKECIDLVQKLDKLKLPKETHDINHRLIGYCELRIESYQFLYKKFDEDTDKYQAQIEACDKKLTDILNSFNIK